tara:strand:- start:345 stop:494 length:150 start_codon:yes stop_codon:yes gene_type:complete
MVDQNSTENKYNLDLDIDNREYNIHPEGMEDRTTRDMIPLVQHKDSMLW